ncbi:MAG: 1-acyl-sn-glycerol-3-phosphate acyltransferase [Candidatus Koribacter versatilis]|uniref:1-acyl-sn-glycerol-3-phosphate acyltransferase n=1 Tax=Candidatus Korobacter versatilis TaxID=658062 RepID=A0A932A7H2_9BACT|nr:1-acyl-sn-glycerol-3-phosphate acyltransferase [Candidatus Koribacter versatilis]
MKSSSPDHPITGSPGPTADSARPVARPGGTLSYLRSILVLNNLIYAYTIVLGAISLVASVFARTGRTQHRLARIWSWLILQTAMVRVAVAGRERVDIAKPHLYAFNHASAMDIPVLYVHLPFQFRIIAKHELFKYPFLGWHLRRSGQIPIDRDNAHASFRSLRNAVAGLKAGMPLVVFPEGGRTATGELQPFLPGAFYVAIKAQVEVVPCAIVGTYDVLPINTFHIHPGPVEVVFGEPIATTGLTLHDMDRLSERVRVATAGLLEDRSGGR